MISESKFLELVKIIKRLNKKVEDIKTKNFSVSKKQDNSPLTEADLYVNESLNNFIKTTEYKNVISEENKEVPYKIRSKWDLYWVVDPIDGTKEFVKKGNDYTINIALCKGESPIFGLVSVPNSSDIYHAFSGKGAYKNNDKIEVVKPDKVINIIASKSHINEDTKKYIDEISSKNITKIINVGSSLKICYVAEGKAHIYPRFGPTMEWDTCAAQIIIEEAGGTLLDKKKKQLKYNKEDLHNPHFIASFK